MTREQKWGTAEYLFTKPVSRTKIVLAKVVASMIDLVIFSVFCGLCNYTMLVLPMGGLERPGAVLAAYAAAITAEYTGNRALDWISPLRYFDICDVALHGIRTPHLLLTVVIAAGCTAAAAKLWDRREL